MAKKMHGLRIFVRSLLQRVSWGVLCLWLAACTGPRSGAVPSVVGEAYSPGRGFYKVGEPYQIRGIWYYPHEDYDYHETGTASWYGMDFHGKETANGEMFDMHALTAAHRTLPMPSIVRVTNFANGRALAVRVNDRGPFVNDRIIDLSRRSAQLLGFEASGTTSVRVEILAEESLALKNRLLRDSMLATGPKIEATPQIAVVTEQSQPLKVTTPSLPSSSPTIPAPPAAARPTAGKAVTETSYYIQVASFGNAAFAHQASKHLTGIGRVALVPQVKDGRILYRLSIGPFTRSAEAEGRLVQVHKAGYADAWIVKGE